MKTKMKPWRQYAALGLVMLMLTPVTALAHREVGQATGFLSGFEHPISGLDHVLAMIAVGLWGAVLGPPALWVLPVAFPVMMAFGGFMGLLGFPLPGVEIGIAISARLKRLSMTSRSSLRSGCASDAAIALVRWLISAWRCRFFASLGDRVGLSRSRRAASASRRLGVGADFFCGPVAWAWGSG